MSNTERFKQTPFFCPFLTQKHEVEDKSMKWNGQINVIASPSKFEIAQSQAISILDSEKGSVKILCSELSKGHECMAHSFRSRRQESDDNYCPYTRSLGW